MERSAVQKHVCLAGIEPVKQRYIKKNPLFLFLFQNRCLTTLTKNPKTYFFTLATVTFTADSSQENGWLFYTCFNATKNARAHQEDHTDESLTLLRRQGNSNMCFSVLICTNHNGELGRNKQDRVKHQKNTMSVLLIKLPKEAKWQDASLIWTSVTSSKNEATWIW